jgi:hypothetical protein
MKLSTYSSPSGLNTPIVFMSEILMTTKTVRSLTGTVAAKYSPAGEILIKSNSDFLKKSAVDKDLHGNEVNERNNTASTILIFMGKLIL